MFLTAKMTKKESAAWHSLECMTCEMIISLLDPSC